MGKSTKDIIVELRAHAEYLDYPDLPKREEIAKTLQDAIDLISDVSERPEGADPRMKNANPREISKVIASLNSDIFKHYRRQEKRLYALRIIRWYVNCAIERLEKGK